MLDDGGKIIADVRKCEPRTSWAAENAEKYSEIIEKHLKVKLGECELEELSPIVIQKYITELMQSGNLTTGKGLTANSVNGIIIEADDYYYQAAKERIEKGYSV